MSVRPTLRVGPALLGLVLIVGACSGSSGAQPANAAGNGANGGNGNVPATASAEPAFDLGSLLSPDPTPDATPDATPAPSPSANALGSQPTPKPAGTNPPAISTAKASSLLSQVDHLLNEVDGELSNADAAANNPGE